MMAQIADYMIRSCAELASVRYDLAAALAEALDDPLGPGFAPLAELIDAHGIDATRDLLRRLLAVPEPVKFTPIGRMA